MAPGQAVALALVAWATVTCRADDVVPLVLWSGGAPAAASPLDPLHVTSGPELRRILDERLVAGVKPPALLFVKDELCVEELRKHSQTLQKVDNGSPLYLTSVKSALSVFENLSSYDVIKKDDVQTVAEGQLALIEFTDLSDVPDRYKFIRQTSPNLVVGITGKSCKYSVPKRIKRDAGSAPKVAPFIIRNEKILLYAETAPTIKIDKAGYAPLTLTRHSVDADDNKQYNLTMSVSGLEKQSSATLKAQFDIRNRYFKLSGFHYYPEGESGKEIFLRSTSEIVFPFNVSYHCAQTHVFTHKTKDAEIHLKLSRLQVQMDAKNFGRVQDCVGFMSVPILTGIFVTAILGLILIWGITMILDIRTMDRFDDPKAKTITVSASE